MADDKDISIRLRLDQLQKFFTDAHAGKKSIDELIRKAHSLGEAQKRQAENSNRSAQSIRNLSGSYSNLKQIVTGIWISQAVIGVGQLASELVRAAAGATTQLENVQVGYTRVLGSTQLAKSMIKDLQEFSDWSPFADQDVLPWAQQLMQAGMGLKEIIPAMTAVGDAVTAFGGGPGEVSGAVTAIRQISSSSKLLGQDINQLAQHGINVKKILSQTFGVTVEQLSDYMDKGGSISSKVAIPAILRGLQAEFGGLLRAQSQTITGYATTIKSRLLRAVTFEPESPEATALRDWLGKFASDENMNRVTAKIRGVVTRLADAIKSAKRFYDRLMDISRTQGARRLLGDIGDALHWIKNTLGNVLSPIGTLIGYLNDHGNTGKVGSDLDRIAAFCENKAVQDFFKGIAVYAGSMWAFNSATRATAASMGILKGSMAFLGVGGTGKAAGGAAVGRFAGLGPFGKILTAVGVGGFFASKHTGGKWDDDIDRYRQQWSESKGVGGKAWMTTKWVGSVIGGAITDPISGAFESVFTKDGKANQAMLGWIRGIGDALKGVLKDVNNWFVDQVNRAFSLRIPGTNTTIGPNLPHAAARGATTTSGGLLTVGEAGREILALPRGASVIPLQRASSDMASAASGQGGYHAHPIEVDGRELMRVVHRHEDTVGARR